MRKGGKEHGDLSESEEEIERKEQLLTTKSSQSFSC